MGTYGTLTQHFAAGDRSQNEGCYNRYNRASQDSWKEHLKTFCEFVIKFQAFNLTQPIFCIAILTGCIVCPYRRRLWTQLPTLCQVHLPRNKQATEGYAPAIDAEMTTTSSWATVCQMCFRFYKKKMMLFLKGNIL